MEATPLPGRFRGQLRCAGVVLALTSLATSFQAGAQDKDQVAAKEAAAVKEQVAGNQQAVAAVWKVREVEFVYRSSAAIYTCSALQDRVASIMRGVGARDDVDVRVTNCDTAAISQDVISGPSSQSGPGSGWDVSGSMNNRQNQFGRFSNRADDRDQKQSVYVRVRAMIPTEVTPEIIKELERDKSRRELISKVTGNPAAGLNDAVVFPAQRQVVTLDRKTIGLEPAECELLEQMSTGIFRQLGMKIVRSSSFCTRNSVSHIPPRITVESLMGVPVGATSIPMAPAAGETPAAGSATPPESEIPPAAQPK
jgi:hypothetical protein